MDIHKEREAFEAVPEIKQWVNALRYGEKTGVYIAIDNDKHQGVASWVNGAWWIWQAKAQAVHEGFVVVNKKELAKVLNCVTDNWLIDTGSVEEFKKIESLVQDEIDEMFKAWEPANE